MYICVSYFQFEVYGSGFSPLFFFCCFYKKAQWIILDLFIDVTFLTKSILQWMANRSVGFWSNDNNWCLRYIWNPNVWKWGDIFFCNTTQLIKRQKWQEDGIKHNKQSYATIYISMRTSIQFSKFFFRTRFFRDDVSQTVFMYWCACAPMYGIWWKYTLRRIRTSIKFNGISLVFIVCVWGEVRLFAVWLLSQNILPFWRFGLCFCNCCSIQAHRR